MTDYTIYVAVINGKIVGWSHKKKIIDKYLKSYFKYHPSEEVLLAQIINSNVDYESIPDQEIIHVGKIYLQRKYEEPYYISNDIDPSEVKLIESAILMLEDQLKNEFKMKKRKVLIERLTTLNDVLQNLEMYTPSIDEMEYALQSIEEWRNCVYGE